MRWIMVIALLMAAPTWAQDQPTWRAHDLGEHWVRGQNLEIEEPLFHLLGLAAPSKHQYPEGLGIDDQELSLKPRPTLKFLRSFVPDAKVIAGETQLLVLATANGHKIVDRALDLLRPSGYLQIDVRELVLSKEQFARREIRGAVTAAIRGRMDQQTWRKVRDAGGARGLRGGTLRATPGFWTRLEQTRRVRYIPDFDVEIAQAAAVPDPIAQHATDGLRVLARGYPLSDGRVLLQIASSSGELEPEMHRFEMKAADLPESLKIRDTDFGFVEQARFRGACLSTELLLREGQPVAMVLGSPDRSSGSVRILVVTLRKTLPRLGPDTMTLLPAGAFSRRALRRRLGFGQGGALAWMPAASAEVGPRMEDVEQRFKRMIEDDAEAWVQSAGTLGGSLLVRASKERIAQMRRQLAEMESQLLHPVLCEIQLFRQLAGRKEWVGEATPVLLAGGRAAFGAYHRLDYIGDYDVEVAQESRIADPVHMHATQGLIGDVAVWRRGADRYRAKLNLRVLALGPVETVATHAGGVGPIQRIPRSERGSNYFLDLEAGRPIELDLGLDPNDPEGQVRLVATVSVSPAGK